MFVSVCENEGQLVRKTAGIQGVIHECRLSDRCSFLITDCVFKL